MVISIWRYSHLTLAISSALFIIIASVTGIILAFEPISNQLKPYAIENLDTITVSNTIASLQKEYQEVISIEVNNDDFVMASVITKEGKAETFYIQPETGKKLGNIIKKARVYEFSTNLHRSLFLKSTGRFIVGFVSFLLFLISVTGVILIAKRQGGFKRYFSKIIKEDFEQYYHIVIGRYVFIPIIIITLTGVFLSMEKFSLLPFEKTSHQITKQNEIALKTDFKSFEIFKTIFLKDVKQIEFPFSDDAEDYFLVKLKDKELMIHQYNGQIASNHEYSLVHKTTKLSLKLHTGQGSILWSIILIIASASTLFFIYSGFKMTFKRKKKTLIPKNKFNKDNSEYIILVGSENGSTFGFASIFYNALISKKKKVFISELNSYSYYKKAKHIIIFTATYGEGDAPSNSKSFKDLFISTDQKQVIKYSIIGFGSLKYPNYCKYAIYVDSILQQHSSFIPNMPLFKINNQSFDSFKNWVQEWNIHTKTSIKITQNGLEKEKTETFKVVHKTNINHDNSFLLQVKPKKKTRFNSGDLLSITPENETESRLYSIGKVDNTILLSIKKHELGICSKYLSKLTHYNRIKAVIKENKKFHFPKGTKTIIMISNGTGIAPFLGMIHENTTKRKIHLFWGGRTKESFKIYTDLIHEAEEKESIASLHIAYSQETKQKNYIQDLILSNYKLIAKTLKEGGTIMICGSISMQKGVINVLENISKKELNIPLDVFENNQQIKIDCY